MKSKRNLMVILTMLAAIGGVNAALSWGRRLIRRQSCMKKGILTRMREAATFEEAHKIMHEGSMYMASQDTRRKWDKCLAGKATI